MATSDLRPLSLGEMLDRTFSLYRQNFWLFMGINAIPQVLVLALNLFRTWDGVGKIAAPLPMARGVAPGALSGTLGAVAVVAVIVGAVIYLVAYLFAQGGTVYAVSELYLGRPTSITASLQRMRGHAVQLFVVTFLSGLAIAGGFILLVIPGIYVACRLAVAVPGALVEDLGGSESLSRSWNLTRDYAGRSFVIYLLYFVLLVIASAVLAFPFGVMSGLSVHDPAAARMWLELGQLRNFIATILVVPFLTVATAVFYFDLRIRKEAFDLQVLMNPGAGAPVAASGTLPSMTP